MPPVDLDLYPTQTRIYLMKCIDTRTVHGTPTDDGLIYRDFNGVKVTSRVEELISAGWAYLPDDQPDPQRVRPVLTGTGARILYSDNPVAEIMKMRDETGTEVVR